MAWSRNMDAGDQNVKKITGASWSSPKILDENIYTTRRLVIHQLRRIIAVSRDPSYGWITGRKKNGLSETGRRVHCYLRNLGSGGPVLEHPQVAGSSGVWANSFRGSNVTAGVLHCLADNSILLLSDSSHVLLPSVTTKMKNEMLLEFS
ncbi:unnamed protein product [Nezara viridula]|uniref:Uncharacterized protein n=1 Tax=Nezara viridula TaxID=85310 RepID=A0A9P0E0F2_NEZVI|nr:unnamed protein product [Nezara viridula]